MKRHVLTALLSAALLPLVACGQTPVKQTQNAPTSSGKVNAADAQAITQKLEQAYASQNLKVQAIQASPIAGLYEVVVSGKQVIYTDAKADYMLVGDLIDVNNRKSLTDERSSELSKVDYSSLPLDLAIKEVRGNGKLQVAVFSDPDCPFCKRLEQEFAKMTDITIYNFMMPIASLHPQAAKKAEQIWCQPNRTTAWTQWMRANKVPPTVAVCDNPIAETTSLGEQLGFNGTPAIVFPNGKTHAGYAPMPQLQELIESNQQ